MERVTEVYYSDGYTPDDLIHYFWMNFTIDTLGRCVDLEIPDTCRRQTIIVKERTLELLRAALAGIDSFQPATEKGEKVPYRQTMEYDFAYISEVITPACFKKSEPNDFTALQRYISRKIVFPQDLAHSGISGRVIITFIVDTDGSVKIDKVLESPHPKMSYRVKKIILSTSGKWTPATYFGAPIQQRGSFFTGNASKALIPGSYTTPSGTGVFFISSTSCVKSTLVITLPYLRNAGSFTDKICILLYQPFSIIAQT